MYMYACFRNTSCGTRSGRHCCQLVNAKSATGPYEIMIRGDLTSQAPTVYWVYAITHMYTMIIDNIPYETGLEALRISWNTWIVPQICKTTPTCTCRHCTHWNRRNVLMRLGMVFVNFWQNFKAAMQAELKRIATLEGTTAVCYLSLILAISVGEHVQMCTHQETDHMYIM